jgi:transposase
MAEGRRRKDVTELAGVSLPTVDRWVDRCAEQGLAGLEKLKREVAVRRHIDKIMAVTPAAAPHAGIATS